MTLANVQSQLVFNGFNAQEEGFIRSLIARLYSGSGTNNGSQTARTVLDKTFQLNRQLTIDKVSDQAVAANPTGGAGAFPNLFKIFLNPTYIQSLAYITSTGKSIQYDPALVVIHEIVHAIEGLTDRRNTSDNSAGDTQTFTNQVHRELGIPERISYEGAGFASFLTPGRDFTGGNAIDVALLADGTKDTSANSPGTRDLIIGRTAGRHNFKTGDGDDYLYGSTNDDIFTGGGDDDVIIGGDGRDIARYSGSCSEYNFTANSDGSFIITDKRTNSPDGTDRLRQVEIAEFSDGKVTLTPGKKPICPGPNALLVIDVSGSMSDDIEAVKASANQIVDALYGTDADPVAARLGIITFNDTGAIRTVLNFTDQENIADRKAAALAGIASIEILGGGAEPLNGAVLSALTGGAGSWDEGSNNNKIIVFSDEPPADPELRSQVLALAADTNIGVSAQAALAAAVSTDPLADNTDETFNNQPFVDDSGPVPVSVLPILVGNNPTARADFQALADGTGGRLFTAADASEIVEAVIGAIETPISNSPPTLENPIGDQSVNEDALLNFTLPAGTFDDPDAGDTLTFDATLSDGTNLPAWLTFNSSTNTFTGTPTNDDVGILDIQVTATDDSGESAGDSFSLTIVNTNDAPIISSPLLDVSASAYRPFNLTIPANTFVDVDRDPLTLSATLENGNPLPSWLTFDSATNTFSGFPLSDDVNVININLTGDDGNGGTITGTFELSVSIPFNSTTNSINGDSSGNFLRGTAAADLIDGREGNDVVQGFVGNDNLLGRGGKDSILGNDGNDVIDGGDDNDFLFGNRGDDLILGDNGRDVLLGQEDNDILDGGNGRDFVQGGAGNDLIIGGRDDDSLWGGAGNDRFVLQADSSNDYIFDYQDGVDKIVLGSGLKFSDLTVRSFGFVHTELFVGNDPIAVLWKTNVNSVDASDFAPFS
jgi:Ca2+-binding RTX toxin-like protein